MLDKTETLDKSGTQESVGVTLTVTHNFRDLETEDATSCIQAGTPMEKERPQTPTKLTT